jgi:hypothetical protein
MVLCGTGNLENNFIRAIQMLLANGNTRALDVHFACPVSIWAFYQSLLAQIDPNPACRSFLFQYL